MKTDINWIQRITLFKLFFKSSVLTLVCKKASLKCTEKLESGWKGDQNKQANKLKETVKGKQIPEDAAGHGEIWEKGLAIRQCC